MSAKKGPGAAELLLLAASILVSLYAAQAMVLGFERWQLSRPPVTMRQLARHWGLRHDDRSAFQVFTDLRKQGKPAGLPFCGIFVLPDGLTWRGKPLYPIAGQSRRLVVAGNESGEEYYVYPTDEHGFSNPTGLYRPGGVDVALIGDSFAESASVRPEETIAARLRRRYPRTLSLGKGGFGALLELAVLREYAAPLRPKNVFWLYYVNDVQDTDRESQSAFLRRYLDPKFSQHLFARQPEIDAAWQAFYEKNVKDYFDGKLDTSIPPSDHPSTRQRLKRFLTLAYLGTFIRQTYPLSRPDERHLKLFFQVLDEARREVQGWGGHFYFVYLPEREFFVSRRRADRFRRPVLRGVQARGIPVLDELKVFSRQPDPLSLFWFRTSVHYNPDGYRLVAGSIEGELASRQASASRRAPVTAR